MLVARLPLLQARLELAAGTPTSPVKLRISSRRSRWQHTLTKRSRRHATAVGARDGGGPARQRRLGPRPHPLDGSTSGRRGFMLAGLARPGPACRLPPAALLPSSSQRLPSACWQASADAAARGRAAGMRGLGSGRRRPLCGGGRRSWLRSLRRPTAGLLPPPSLMLFASSLWPGAWPWIGARAQARRARLSTDVMADDSASLGPRHQAAFSVSRPAAAA